MAEPLLQVRFACPLPSRANEQHGRRRRGRQGKKGGHLGDKISLPAEQRAATAAALGWWCPRCEEPGMPLRRGAASEVPGALVAMVPDCRRSGGAMQMADPRPPIIAGPEHPVDVLLVRYPSLPRGNLLDPGNKEIAFKAVQDEVMAQLWRWSDLEKLLGKKPDDSVKWIRWCYEQSTEGRVKGTELCEVVIAEREDIPWPTPAVLVRWLEGAL